MKWYLRACPVDGGDLHEDLEDENRVVCFLCARIFEKGDVPEVLGKQSLKRGPKGPQAHPRQAQSEKKE